MKVDSRCRIPRPPEVVQSRHILRATSESRGASVSRMALAQIGPLTNLTEAVTSAEDSVLLLPFVDVVLRYVTQ